MKVADFQELMRKLYFHQDKKRGISKTFLWLVEEVGELANVLRKEETINKEEASEEIADIIAWVNSVANLLEINVEEALSQKYPDKCMKCGNNPCSCGS